ncbi:hypothetical protein TTHERM_000149659 (macronuclear) [Tetrahymena thermophila SB210]|uniref:Uncharacterized protein n=1 Tax=Tetrahymena thermophila (strain SB210) TaxID=312017 RepID=W7XG19_TETTS|nr:hypothetical protein TTHERM_000149659 [Tetrahymena thermophila SB210]EWS73026.1 hypothetical protein TTHERM_000149659 [Tetrahymena thermophila SB210]|eukprot:XP_012654423.1 hypothetical protein TTHERM_000149659 [Tetrahymena thermophila SB210]
MQQNNLVVNQLRILQSNHNKLKRKKILNYLQLSFKISETNSNNTKNKLNIVCVANKQIQLNNEFCQHLKSPDQNQKNKVFKIKI